MTNCRLAAFAGTEMYLRDVAGELRRRGHEPAVYSPVLGPAADVIACAGVQVTDDLDAIEAPPDVIHGQHHLPTMTALARFPSAPAVAICHGTRPWEERPPVHPRVLRYIAVDEATRDRVLREAATTPDRVDVISNFVSTARFRPRGPLPASASRVLLYSNYATPASAYYQAARLACERLGLALDVVGERFGTATERPEDVLGGYEIVLAQGRSAIEALAVGAMVVVCSSRAFGPPVTPENLDAMRARNFGLRTLTHPVDAAVLETCLRAYDAEQAQRVSDRVRREATVEQAVDRVLVAYDSAVTEWQAMGGCDEEEQAGAMGRYLGRLCRDLEAVPALLRDLDASRRDVEVWREDSERQRRALHLMRSSGTWRLRTWLLGNRVIGGLQRRLRQRLRDPDPDEY